jgi:hypothetical protein
MRTKLEAVSVAPPPPLAPAQVAAFAVLAAAQPSALGMKVFYNYFNSEYLISFVFHTHNTYDVPDEGF